MPIVASPRDRVKLCAEPANDVLAIGMLTLPVHVKVSADDARVADNIAWVASPVVMPAVSADDASEATAMLITVTR